MATIVSNTIGSGQTYSTIMLWWDDCPISLTGSDQIWKGVITGSTFNETPAAQLIINNTNVDIDRYLWLTVASGDSVQDNLDTNPLRESSSYGAMLTGNVIPYTPPFVFTSPYMRVERLQIVTHRTSVASRVRWFDCIISSTASPAQPLFTFDDYSEVTNCLIKTTATNQAALTLGEGGKLTNCTVVVPSSVTTSVSPIAVTSTGQAVKNCAIFANGIAALPTAPTYTNCYTNRASPPSGCTTVAYDTTTGSGFENTTTASADFKLKSTSALINTGTDTGAPTTDIAGTTRAATDVGAWEYVGGAVTATFTITATDTFSGSASVAGASPTATLSLTTGSTFSGSASVVTGSGTLTTPPLKNNTGMLLTSETGITVNVYNMTTGALVVQKTGQTSHATTAVVVVTDALIIPATQYRVVVILMSGADGLDKITAS